MKWNEYLKDRTIYNECLRHRKFINIIINTTPKNSKLIEIGCGTGIISFLLKDYGYNVVATDIDISSVRIDINPIKANMFELSKIFTFEFFDLAFHKGVMEHFQDSEIIEGLAQQRQIAKRVLFNVPNNRSSLHKRKTGFGDERLLPNGYWVKLIKKAGWREVKIHDADYYSKVFFWQKFFGNHTIFECKK